jgi:hypothetical protein
MSEKYRANSAPPATTTSAPPEGGASSLENTAGRVSFDSRGNAVWEWRSGDGQFQKDASTSMVRLLQPDGLSLEATMRVQNPVAGPVEQDRTERPLAAAQPWAEGRESSAATIRFETPKTGQSNTPGSRREVSGFDPYNSGRGASHALNASRRPLAKPARGPVEPERKGLLARLTRRKP